MSKYDNFNSLLKKADLQNIHMLKAMIDGKGIQVLYDCKPGKHIKSVADECIKFQILNVHADRSEVESFLKERQEEFMKKYMWKNSLL